MHRIQFVKLNFIVFLVIFPVSVKANDPIADRPALSSGFYEAAASRIEDQSNNGDFTLSLSLASRYDSNITQGDGRVRPEEADLLFQPSFNASYLIGNSKWQLGTRGELSRQTFFETDEFDATNYSFGLYGGYRSKKIVASFTSDYARNGGVNRLAGEFIEQTNLSGGLLASYRFSGKTSLLSSWDYSEIQNDSAGFGDQSSVTWGLSGLWKMTPKTQFGPGLRYGVRSDQTGEDFTLLGPTFRLNYTFSTKVKLRSTFGYDSADSPFSPTQNLFNWSLSLDYRASARWGFGLKMIRDSQAAFVVGGGFDQVSALRFTYWRKIRKARLELGASYEEREPQDSVVAGIGQRDLTFGTLNASLTLPIYKDDLDLTLDCVWRDQSSVDEAFSWSGTQIGLSLRYQF